MFENFPYSNFHDLNTDWIVKKIKDVETSEANAKASEENAKASELNASLSDASAQTWALQANNSVQRASEQAKAAAQSAQDAEDTVEKTNAQVQLLQSRVDNIIPSGTQTEGNTELLDIRVEYDGTVADSAGNAVRAQVRNLKNAIEQSENGISNGLNVAMMPSAPLYGKTITLDYTKIPTEVGYINTVGEPSSTSNRHFKLPMYGIKRITITPEKTLTNILNYAYYWKNSEGILRIAISGTITQTTSYILTEPTDGYFYINYFTGGQYTSEIEIEFFDENIANKNIENLISSVNSIDNSINTLDNSINTLDNLNFLKKPFSFNGKTATFFGDSIVYGVASPNLHYIGDNCFCKRFGNYVGLTVKNQGVSGSCICDNSSNSITNKILNYSQSADFIFIAGGVNDYQAGKPLGTYGDTTIETFYGALHLICEKLKTDYPNTTVIFITPINVNRYRDFSNAIYSINAYRKAIFEIACAYGFNVVDGSKIGFPTETGGFASALMVDGIHPTDYGHQFYAMALCGKLL